MPKRDYYEVLGVSKTATADEIRSAYRKLARKFHPDVTGNDAKATERFKEIQEANDVLSDASKRTNYDQFGHAGVGGMPGGGGSTVDPYEQFRRNYGRRNAGGNGGASSWNGGQGVTVEDFDFGGGDMGSIFEQLFGKGGMGGAAPGARRQGRRGRTQPAEAQRGQDIEHAVTLTFEQAFHGTTLPLQINRDGHLESIDIKIPPGVKDGSRVRIRGKGQMSGGEPGDLFIITQVQPHAYFRRDGLDINLDLPISLYEAVLGAKVQVPTVDGPVTLTIPPGSSSGAKLRIKGRGIVRGEEKGDQIVILKVVIPKDLDDADRDSIRAIQTKHPLNVRADLPW
jgi:DnaJ-class molecular chaperone